MTPDSTEYGTNSTEGLRDMSARRSKAADQALRDMRRRGWLLLTIGSGGLALLLVLAAVVGQLASTGGH